MAVKRYRQRDDLIPDLEDQHGDNQSRDWVSDKMFEDFDVYTAVYYGIRSRIISVQIDDHQDPEKYITCSAEYWGCIQMWFILRSNLFLFPETWQ